MSSYIVGDLASDASELGRGGWVIGDFFDDVGDARRRSGDLEVKHWSYPRGGGQSHGLKSSATTEWTYILCGRVRAIVGDSNIEMGAGEYVLIHPNTPNNLVAEVIEDIIAITVKAPSNPQAKTLL